MTLRFNSLAALLFLMPLLAIADGLALAPFAMLLFLLLAWPQRRQLAHWRAIEPAALRMAALLIIWPALTSVWSIIPRDSLITALRFTVLVALALLGASILPAEGIYRTKSPLSSPLPQAGEREVSIWYIAGLGMALAALLILASVLPGGGPMGWGVTLLHHDQIMFLGRNINRGLCALCVLVWPVMLGLLAAQKRGFALVLPWLLLAGLCCLHSLSAKTGMCAGLVVFYVMQRWPLVCRRMLLWGVPMFLLAWPLLFYIYEPLLRVSLYDALPPSSQHRVEIWHFVLSKWQERPWLGWGIDSSRAIPGGQEEFRNGEVYLPLHPHNLPLHILLEQGVIGFGLFLTALVLFLRRALAIDTLSRPALAVRAAAIVAYLTVAMSGFGMWQGWWQAVGFIAFLLTVFGKVNVQKI